MNGRGDGENPFGRFSANRYDREAVEPFRRPFWLNAASYYALAAAATVLFFFLVWTIFQEENEELPWLLALIGAALVFGGAVVVREVLLRNSRNRYMKVERSLDGNVKKFPSAAPRRALDEAGKLTLEKNAAIVKDIQKKSDHVRALNKINGSGHLEMFEICHDYLALTEKQMETVRAGSPRIAGIRRGREIVGELHRYHLLNWAEIESKTLTQKAQNYVTISEKLNTAQEALTVLDSARQFYPNESQLVESEAALRDFIASIKISHWIEQAERAAFKGNYKRAVSLYRDALFFLAREDVKTEDSRRIAEKINREIESLRGLSAKKEIERELNRGLSND